MSSPTLGPSSLSTHATAIAAIIGSILLLGIHINELFRGRFETWYLFLLPLAAILADVVSGIVHWTADTWGSETTPFLGARFIRPFRVHHLNGQDIVSRRFIDLNGDVALGVLPFLALAFLVPDPVRFLLVALSMCILPTNQIHQWAHREEAPRIVRALQRRGLILRPAHHLLHHTEPFASHYCITTGWANRVLERLRLFDRTERFVRAGIELLIRRRPA